MHNAVSIVIATADRVRCVLDCVESFREQVPSSVELIVVDAGREERVDEQALRALWPNARVIAVAERSASTQRNVGVEAADSLIGSADGEPLRLEDTKGEEKNARIIIFLDDDVIVNAGWWPKILEPLVDPQVAVVQGGVHSSRNPTLLSERGGYVKWTGMPVACIGRGPDAPRELEWPMTTNMAVRKSVFEELGGFDPYYGVYEEDVDFGLRVRKTGFRIVHEASASVYHYGHWMLRRPPTKNFAYRKGRNMAYMLARNYGVSVRLVVFLLLVPWHRLGKAVVASVQFACRQLVHYGAYLVGVVRGALDGRRGGGGR